MCTFVYITDFLIKFFNIFSEELLKKGIILVLDRRKDKWGAVKSCLQKIQVCKIVVFESSFG